MTIREASEIVPDVTRMRTGDDEQIPDADPMAGAIETVEQAAYVRGRGDGYAAAERDIVAFLRQRKVPFCLIVAREIEAGAHRTKWKSDG